MGNCSQIGLQATNADDAKATDKADDAIKKDIVVGYKYIVNSIS